MNNPEKLDELKKALDIYKTITKLIIENRTLLNSLNHNVDILSIYDSPKHRINYNTNEDLTYWESVYSILKDIKWSDGDFLDAITDYLYDINKSGLIREVK